jgi:hypothetical protein
MQLQPNKKALLTYVLFAVAAFGTYKLLPYFILLFADGFSIFGFLLHIPIAILAVCVIGLGVASFVIFIYDKLFRKK